MKRIAKHQLSRRSFITTSILGFTGVSLLPFKSFTRPGDTINIGIIGLGRMSNSLLKSFIRIDGVRVQAGADVYEAKRIRFANQVNDYYSENEIDQRVDIYEDYRRILDRKDINAVIISSPDHWHAIQAIEACRAGKDVYLEKPVSFTIKEGQELIKAVRQHNRILAVGSQQRSDKIFMHATKKVLEGDIGKLKKIYVHLGTPPHPRPYTLSEESVPAGLNWEKWLGPLPNYHYNPELNPPISLDPPVDEQFWGGWRWYKEFGGGFMTDWGAHMIDIAQWGMGCDRGGPVKVTPAGFNGTKYLTYNYDNGVELTVWPFMGARRGVRFLGSKGSIKVARNYFRASRRSMRVKAYETDVPYEGRSPHHHDFIDALKNRRDPIVPVEVGHATCVACTLGNIAHELKRPVNWDPANESFVNDAEASKYLHYEYQRGYRL